MDIHEYLCKMKNDQSIILDFLENEDTTEDEFQSFKQFYNDRHELKPILHLLSAIMNYHHRKSDFFEKIKRLILIFQDKIKSFFTDIEICRIFQTNYNIHLFLLENNIIKLNKNTVDVLNSYFIYPEIKSFIDEKKRKAIESELFEYDSDFFNNYEEKRKNGENESYLAGLIRNDSVEEFIIYVNKTNLSISNSKIAVSLFETNHFLAENDAPTLIEYAAFFGSIQIFQYLQLNNVLLTPSLWIYSIHGKNPDIIHILEENGILPEDETYKECIKESIKCHHVDITNYLLDKIACSNQNQNDLDDKLNMENCFNYYNFEYFPSYINDINLMLHYACKYNYFMIVKLLLEVKDIDINFEIIFT